MIDMIPEDHIQVTLRKYGNILNVAGLGIIIFGVWSVIKNTMMLLARDDMVTYVAEATGNDKILEVLTYVMLYVIVLVDLLVRVWVGCSARSFARGKRKTIIYEIITIGLICLSIISCVDIFLPSVNGYEKQFFDLVAAGLVELTSIFNMVQLILYSEKIRGLERRLRKGVL